ncbi:MULTISPECIES: DUF6113 family protein [Herbidospora]|uniref:DUF6113 family protein n=1 Tax=Herbidospora TaxID=28443 RepID=UPI00068EB00E|nr:MULTISPECIES: DUF6113 family protein [Herbidospora]GLX98941.1 hypothetical protein Hesp01_68910 [Herbidospora sp. NBRC 101105]
MMVNAAPETAEHDDGPSGAEPAVTGAAYGVLFMLGLVVGVVGAFEHEWYLFGTLPVGAVLAVLILFGLPYAMGRLMRTRMAAGVVAVGWVIPSMILAGPRPEGDLAIAATLGGYIYLYGGLVAVALAVVFVPSAGGSWLLRQNVRIR